MIGPSHFGLGLTLELTDKIVDLQHAQCGHTVRVSLPFWSGDLPIMFFWALKWVRHRLLRAQRRLPRPGDSKCGSQRAEDGSQPAPLERQPLGCVYVNRGGYLVSVNIE